MRPSSLRSDCNCLALRQAARAVTQLYDRALSEVDLRSTQFSILSRLSRVGPSSINGLAAELVMDRTTLGRNLLPLTRDGLVAVVRSPEDRREKHLDLTRLGRARLKSADSRWQKAQRQFESAFGRKRSADLRDLMREVVTSSGGEVSESELA